MTAHVTAAPPALVPSQLLASDVITRNGVGLFGNAKVQYEHFRSLFLATPDPTGERLLERTLALVEPLLGYPVAIIDLGALTEVGIGEAVQGMRTVAGGTDARTTHQGEQTDAGGAGASRLFTGTAFAISKGFDGGSRDRGSEGPSGASGRSDLGDK